jgi:predicted negative regulator of RcsB-dependent stress response
MAFDAYDDYEQSERVQKWLRQNGASIVIGVAIGLIAIFGWQQWRNHKAGHQAAGAQLYQTMQNAQQAGRTDLADQLTDQLIKDYADTAYAAFAASDRALRQLQAGQPDKAHESLDWARKHADEPALKGLLQLRTAQVELAQGKGDQALATLDGIPSGDYRSLAQELRGDVLVKLGRPDDARKAYEAAMAALGVDAPQRGALQMKIDDLAIAGKQGA